MPTLDELFDLLDEAEENDQLASARFLYEAILAQDQANPGLLILHASNLIELGDLTEAELTLEKVEADENTLPGLTTQRGHLARARGHLADAEKFYRDAHKLDPSDDENLLNAAGMAFQRGESAKAEYLLREVIANDSENLLDAWFTLATQLIAQQRYHESRTSFEKVIEIEPHHELAHEWLADLNFREILTREDPNPVTSS